MQTDENVRDACKMDRGKVVVRPLSQVTACMLHQTGCWFGVDKHRLAKHKGDVIAARHERGLEVNAHATAMRHGLCVIAHSPETFVEHGDRANSISVGLEHEGLYEADGDPIDLPAGVDIGEIIEAGRAGLTWFAENLPELRLLIGHRQSRTPPKSPKTADPGARIFREVAIEHGVRKLGLTIDPAKVWGTGRAIPSDWYEAVSW